MGWTLTEAPSQQGKVAIVTGANSGIGFETAKGLASLGAEVILGCRNRERGESAVARIKEADPNASVSLILLDLGSLTSIQAFADEVHRRHSQVDILVNNAGIMMPPKGMTVDGFESQFGVNHLGHFALTARLLSLLGASPDGRVVNVSSVAHRVGKIDFEDLQAEARYGKVSRYGQSKLANLLFTFELERFARSKGLSIRAMASHPGWTATNLQADVGWIRWFNPVFAMKPWQGALPSLFAATAPDAEGGTYYGPDGLLEWRGYPGKAKVHARAKDEDVARRLWDVSEELTQLRFETEAAPRPRAQA
ncbi:MAG: oxidoreductase [Myxococcota bacterium]